LIDRVTQHAFVDTNFVAKKKFGLRLIAKLRGQLLHFSFNQKFHHVGFFFGPVIEYLFV